MDVSERFSAFVRNINLTDDQQADGATKHKGVRLCLNRHYWNIFSESDNSILIGSWGKATRVRPPRDVDVLFQLPYSVYERFQQRSGNKQSALLQEVKSVLESSYPNTDISGDGQIVLVPFNTFKVEVVPAFLQTDGRYMICDTNNGGRYKTTDPKSELSSISTIDSATNGNARALVKMMKCWQRECKVPLKSFHIEILVKAFLTTWQYADKSAVYYDWMVRDFLKFLISKADDILFAPGTYEVLYLGDEWKSRAESAYNRAVKACEFEADKMPYSAAAEWQKIFGTYISA